MSHFYQRVRTVPAACLFVLLWCGPAQADPFIATWDYHLSGLDIPAPSPFYDCPFIGGGGLLCSRLWDDGLEIRSNTTLPMYGDGGPFYDAFGDDLSRSLFHITPACLSGFDPCFTTFTPRSMTTSAFSDDSDIGVYFVSSRGGVIESATGSVTFSGPEWTDVTFMEIGLFLPPECDDPYSGVECGRGEKGLSIDRLAFDATPIPEPASALLVGMALFAALRFRRA